MTPEQKRIQALESTVLDLVAALEEARVGFGERFASRIKKKIGEDRLAYRFARKAPQPTPPAAPEKEETPA